MFNHIVGHEFQKNIIIRAAREGVVSHSYLFSGPDGIGKKLVAVEFAKLLNCAEKPGDGAPPCGCASCRKIDKGIHPDVIVVEFAGVKNIKVDQVREEVEEKLFLRPFEGKLKVVIVDESERMNNSAQNAFLKTLEEPPKESVIVLVTSRPNLLLPTIRSRCQLLGFNPLPQKLIVEILKERTELSAEDALLSAKLSGGSPGKALKLDREIMEWRRDLISELGAMKKHSASDILTLAESVASGSSSADTEKLELAFLFIHLWLRDLVMIKIGSDNIINTDLSESEAKTAAEWGLDDLLDRQRYVEEARYDIFHANANTKLALENLFIKLAPDPKPV